MFTALTQGLRRLTIGTPFEGPGIDAPATDDAGDTVLVALTHGRLGPGERRAFDRHTQRVYASLAQRPGFVGGAIRREIFGRQVWTMTAWVDERSLVEFIRSSHHHDAIQETGGLFVHTQFVRTVVPRRELPLTWDRALEVLASAG